MGFVSGILPQTRIMCPPLDPCPDQSLDPLLDLSLESTPQVYWRTSPCLHWGSFRVLGPALHLMLSVADSCLSEHSMFSCDNGTKCLHLENVCDGISQCHDGSDEHPLCHGNRTSGEGSGDGGRVRGEGPREGVSGLRGGEFCRRTSRPLVREIGPWGSEPEVKGRGTSGSTGGVLSSSRISVY